MTDQLELAFARKAVGQQYSLMNATTWHEVAMAWIAHLPVGSHVSADELIAGVGLPRASEPNRNNAVGATFTAARKAGLIHRVGYKPSTRPEGHGRVIAVWQRKAGA